MLLIRSPVYSARTASAQGSVTKITAATANIFGTWLSVWSCSCVAAWSTLIAALTTIAASRIGNESLTATQRTSRPRSAARLSSELSMEETLHEGAHDEVPAVHEDEQQDLERERDQERRQHHHPHREEGGRDHQVDHQERKEQREPHDEGPPQLADHERGDQDRGGDVVLGPLLPVLRPWLLRHVHEQPHVLDPRLAEHELAQMPLGAAE